MNFLARLLGRSKPEATGVAPESHLESVSKHSSSSSSSAEHFGGGGISFFKRLLPNVHYDSDEETEFSGTSEEATKKKARCSDAETWAHRCATTTILADLAQRCCGCTENNLIIARVRKLRMDNANRSSTERRVFARMLIRSMVKPGTENVSPPPPHLHLSPFCLRAHVRTSDPLSTMFSQMGLNAP